MFKFVLTFLVLLLVNCTDAEIAGGTASEGESYVYGQVTDSTGQALEGEVVYLSRLILSDSGSSTEIEDSTQTDAEGQYEFRPQTMDQALYVVNVGSLIFGDSLNMTRRQSMVSSFKWQHDSTGPSGPIQLQNPFIGPPVKVRGGISNLPQCSGSPIKVFVPGTPVQAMVSPEGRFYLPPLPMGHIEVAFVCDESIQFLPVKIPPGCPEINLPDIEVVKAEDYDLWPFDKYSLVDKTAVLIKPSMTHPDIQEICPNAKWGPEVRPQIPE